jgi:hypothetical protein
MRILGSTNRQDADLHSGAARRAKHMDVLSESLSLRHFFISHLLI